MSTNSKICIKTDDGYIGIYCHNDGYPEHNGKILHEHYNTPEKIKELISPGDLSSLGPKCDKPDGHTFDTPVKGYCVYYGRDRGESNVYPETAVLYDDIASESYNYLYENGKWYVNREDLTDELIKLGEIS